MKKILQIAAILTVIIWGVAFLYFYASGKIAAYLDPKFHIYALLAGIGMIILGLFNLLNVGKDEGACTHDHSDGGCCDHDHHDHGHDHSEEHHHHEHEETTFGAIFAIIVLLLPLSVTMAYSEGRFSSEYHAKWGRIERIMQQMRVKEQEKQRQLAANTATPAEVTNPYTSDALEEPPTDADTPPAPQTNDGSGVGTTEEAPAEAGSNDSWSSFTMEDLKNLVPQSEAGDFLLDVPQIFYTAGDKELMHVMEGIPVETTAQLMEETLNNPDGNRLKAFRLFIECCAADARPLSIPVEFADGLPDYTEMGWYNLFGKLHYSREDDGIVPIMKIDRIESTVEPVDGLLF